ncbi:MAG: MFS transporter [Burkholderiales bacterium]|nr:MFS transporter [Burkholderiales bacterium]
MFGTVGRVGIQALATAMFVKFVAGMMSHSVAAVAPEIKSALDIDYSFIGIYTALTYAGACISALIGGNFVRKYGATRMCEYFLLAYSLSLLLCLADFSAIVVASGLLLGLGKGSVGPATSSMISHHVAKGHANLVYSFKQLSEPFGIALAGLLMPYLAVNIDWQVALTVAAIIGAVGILWCLIERRDLDTYVDTKQKINPKSLGESFKMVMSSWSLLRLAILSICYKGLTITVFAYLVTFLVHRDYSLELAGIALSCSTIGMVLGRLFWGWLADAAHSSRLALGLCGILMGCATIALSQVDLQFAVILVFAIVFVLGFSSKGWTGVFIAQVALHAPEGRVAQATGGVDFFTDVGATFIPLFFSLLVKYWDPNYTLTFYIISALTIATGFLVFFLRHPKVPKTPTATPTQAHA